ncbi:transmembrane protein 220 [Discoglossus pictus]
MEQSDKTQEHGAGDILAGSARSKLWRFCNLLMSLFFALAAYVQVNDPDAEIWMVVYIIPASLIFLVSINPEITGHFIWKRLSELHTSACVAWSLYLTAYLCIYSKKSVLHEEEGRRLSGLMIIVVWMLLCRDSEKQTVGVIRLLIAVSISIVPFLVWVYTYVNNEMRQAWPQHCKTAI